jgi:hypothetical protein
LFLVPWAALAFTHRHWKLWVLSKRKCDTGNVKYDNNNRFDQLQVLISGTAMYRTIN